MSEPSADAFANSTGSAMTEPDNRPRPQYGEYAPIAPVAERWPAPEAPTMVEAPPVNRTRDVVVTTVLLLLGVFDVVTSFATFADLGMALSQVYAQLGIDGTVSAALAAPYGLAINISRVGILAITIVVSLLLIARHRRAFWVPLAGFAVAGIVSSVLIIVVMSNDPAYQAWLAQVR